MLHCGWACSQTEPRGSGTSIPSQFPPEPHTSERSSLMSRLRILSLYGVSTMVLAGQLMSMSSCPNKTQTMVDSRSMLWLIFPSIAGQPGIPKTQHTCQSLLLSQCATKAAVSEHTVRYSCAMHEQFTNFRVWEQVQMNMENQIIFSNR